MGVSAGQSKMSGGEDILDIVANCGEGKLRAISSTVRVPILGRHRAGGTVRTAQAVHTDHEEARHIEGSAVATKQWAPPVTYIGTACQSMANDHGIVPVGRESALGGIGNRHMLERDTRLEGEGGYNSDMLVWDQTRERVLRL